MEGGYGIGKMEALCNILVKEERKLTIIAACGKNEELYNKFCNLKVNENITFIPLPMTEKVLNYIASCDLFIGKGGNSIAEPTFFGHASIISPPESVPVLELLLWVPVLPEEAAWVCTGK